MRLAAPAAGLPPCDTVRRLLRAVARSVARELPMTRRKSGVLPVGVVEDIVNPINNFMNGYFLLEKGTNSAQLIKLTKIVP